MQGRRSFLTGLLAAGLCPRPTWADAGGPAFLSAARRPDGGYVLCGLAHDGQIIFELPLPSRGHAAAAHPIRAEAVAFARRPGNFAIVIDCANGAQIVRLDAPEGRHFYGHGVFAEGGDILLTTENDFDAARGVVGVWDVRAGYKRIGEFESHGIGPHDIKLLPDGRTLVVANGGIETHPETGRTKLNIPTMRPNLTYLSLDGQALAQVELDAALHKNSIRHLAVAGDGRVGFAMQWEGDVSEAPPLLGLHKLSEGGPAQLCGADTARAMHGYLGSIAMNGGTLAVTSPRGGLVQEFSTQTLEMQRTQAITDVCGIAPEAKGFVVTSGTGLVLGPGQPVQHSRQWDNHLVPVTG
ncbi:DUF1513 domain-containing protein [Aliishimia ponticola]|uniref:DUF1513 domain-containing protein n=1 Tax=Aliishimia ponticola TaxID=2499833 RepID=A0A4S4ND95_9RHOB|nr:DUF1513 domain-containing protein [Aliishimia ponticola]